MLVMGSGSRFEGIVKHLFSVQPHVGPQTSPETGSKHARQTLSDCFDRRKFSARPFPTPKWWLVIRLLGLPGV